MLLRGHFALICLLYANCCCCRAIASSVANFFDQNQSSPNGAPLSPIPTLIASQVSSALLNDNDNELSLSPIGGHSQLSCNNSHQAKQEPNHRTKFSYSNYNNNEIIINGDDGDNDLAEPNEDSLGRKEQFSMNSIDHGSQINFSKDLDLVKDEPTSQDEKTEMHTNNHQSANSISGGYNSRFYSAQFPQLVSGNSGLSHYNKLLKSLHPAASGGAGGGGSGNSLNLNYIHSLLAKQPSSSSPSSSQAMSSSAPALNTFSASPTHQKYLYYQPHLQMLQVPFSSSVQAESQQSQQPQPQQPQQQLQQNNSSFISFDSTALPMCGKQQVGGGSSREPRIVGGNKTYEGEFPWAVSIQRHGNHHCGGVIVGKRWILTAAHCVRSQLVGNLVVRTGCHTLTKSINNINSHLERDYLVDQIIMHADFTAAQMKSSPSINNADIALLKLKNDIHWNEFAWPVCFPNREAGNFSGHDAIVIGWGKLNEKSEDFSNELQKVKLSIIDNKLCQSWFRQAGREMPIDDRIICAGFKNGGKDACHGDSGGPLLSKINGHHVVVGVVSTGIGCARPLLPGLYSRVSSYISWIERHVS